MAPEQAKTAHGTGSGGVVRPKLAFGPRCGLTGRRRGHILFHAGRGHFGNLGSSSARKRRIYIMSGIVVYGDPDTSRTWWTVWMCRELALEFKNERWIFLDPYLKSAEYRAINPNGLVPAIKDGDFLLWESMAINLYFAKKYDRGLYPQTLEGEALAWQWSFWAVARVEAPLMTVQVANQEFPQGSDMERYYLRHLPPWSADEVARCREAVEGPFQVLDEHLSLQPYLLGDGFSVADLNVASMLGRNRHAQIGLSTRPHVADWLSRCWSRPACPLREALIEALEAVR